MNEYLRAAGMPDRIVCLPLFGNAALLKIFELDVRSFELLRRL